MQEYPVDRCGACDAPAVFRYALCSPDERPAAALSRRPVYRCPACFPGGKPDYVAEAARADHVDWLLVIDAAYTRDVIDPVCSCGLPADHRNPLSGEPRPCMDETTRIAIPGRESLPPVRPARPVLAAVVDMLMHPRSVTRDENGQGPEAHR